MFDNNEDPNDTSRNEPNNEHEDGQDDIHDQGGNEGGDKPSPFRQGVEKAGKAIDDEGIIEQAPPARPDDQEGDEADDGKPDEQQDQDDPEAAKKKADEEFQAKVDKEIADLKASGEKVSPKTEERLRSLSSRVRELEESSTEFEEIKARLPELEAAAQAAENWEGALASTGADQEQFSRLMGYAYAINKGTREQKMQAREALTQELAWIDKQLGIKSDAYDPLDEYPDLKERVESGNLDEETALELVEKRRLEADRNSSAQQQTKEQEMAEANAKALQEITVYQEQLKKTDPKYSAKLAVLKPTIELIAKNLHPSKWKAEIEKAYNAINLPDIPAAPRRPVPSRQPVRPGPSSRQVGAPTRENAFRFGVQRAKEQGR